MFCARRFDISISEQCVDMLGRDGKISELWKVSWSVCDLLTRDKEDLRIVQENSVFISDEMHRRKNVVAIRQIVFSIVVASSSLDLNSLEHIASDGNEVVARVFIFYNLKLTHLVDKLFT